MDFSNLSTWHFQVICKQSYDLWGTGLDERQTVRTEKLDVVSLPAPSRLCWPGHLDTRQIRQNRQEATWPVFIDTWITFCCCLPGTAFSNSFHPLRQWFSLPNASCGSLPPPLHTVCCCSDVQRATFTSSPNTYSSIPVLGLLPGL